MYEYIVILVGATWDTESQEAAVKNVQKLTRFSGIGLIIRMLKNAIVYYMSILITLFHLLPNLLALRD